MSPKRTARPARPSRPNIQRLLLAQLGIAIIVCALGLFVAGGAAATSALKGGVAALIPNAWFAWRAFMFRGGRFRHQMIQGFYRAQVGKHFLTLMLFAGIFVVSPPQSPGWLFVTFALVQSVYWLSPWLLGRTGSH